MFLWSCSSRHVLIVAQAFAKQIGGKGMPYGFYHGRTGVVFNVNRNAIGVEVTKVVGIRQLRKR